MVRDQLLQIEDLDRRDGKDLKLDRKGIEDLVFREHLRILKEAGFIEAFEMSDTEDDSMHYLPTRLTYTGHEYLDAVRDPEIWKATKSIARTAGGASISFVWEIAEGRNQTPHRTAVNELEMGRRSQE
jgi:hypothetical protein